MLPQRPSILHSAKPRSCQLGNAATTEERLHRRLADAETARRWPNSRGGRAARARQQATEQHAARSRRRATGPGRGRASDGKLANRRPSSSNSPTRSSRSSAPKTSRVGGDGGRCADSRSTRRDTDAGAWLKLPRRSKRFKRDSSQAEAAHQRASERHASDIERRGHATHRSSGKGRCPAGAGSRRDQCVGEQTGRHGRGTRARWNGRPPPSGKLLPRRPRSVRRSSTPSSPGRCTTGRRSQRTLADAEAARQRAEEQRTSDRGSRRAPCDHRRKSRGPVGASRRSRNTLEAKLVDAAAALERAEQRAVIDRQTSTEHASQRQAEFDAQLGEEVAKRQALWKQLAESEAALQRAEQLHASERDDAAAQLYRESEKGRRPVGASRRRHQCVGAQPGRHGRGAQRHGAAGSRRAGSGARAGRAASNGVRGRTHPEVTQPAGARTRHWPTPRPRGSAPRKQHIRRWRPPPGGLPSIGNRRRRVGAGRPGCRRRRARLAEQSRPSIAGNSRLSPSGKLRPSEAAQRQAEFEAELAREVTPAGRRSQRHWPHAEAALQTRRTSSTPSGHGGCRCATCGESAASRDAVGGNCRDQRCVRKQAGQHTRRPQSRGTAGCRRAANRCRRSRAAGKRSSRSGRASRPARRHGSRPSSERKSLGVRRVEGELADTRAASEQAQLPLPGRCGRR